MNLRKHNPHDLSAYAAGRQRGCARRQGAFGFFRSVALVTAPRAAQTMGN
jgi:hypothetical protein